MKKMLSALVIFASCAFGFAHAQEPSKQDAVDLVKKAAASVQAGQTSQLIADVNKDSSDWHKGELYLIVLGLDGKHLAHPTNAKLVGQSMLEVPDEAGKKFRQERVELAKTKGEGWVDYKYKNPQTGKVEDKTLYVLKAGDVILSAGVYK
jgi:cytochrome c